MIAEMNPEDTSTFFDILPKNMIEKSADGQFELDLEKLPNRIVRQIDQFVRSKMSFKKINALKQKRLKKAQEKEKQDTVSNTHAEVNNNNLDRQKTRKNNT